VTRFSRFLLGGMCGVALCAPGLVAQDPDPFAKLDPNSRFAVEAIIDSAQVAGLPWRNLRSRALEAIAKKVDSRRIVAAVRTRFTTLKEARAALGSVGDGELGAAAAVIEVGVKPEQLTALRNPPRGRSPLAALTVLGDLITREVPRDEAISAITKLWQEGRTDADFMGLFHGVESDILQGLNPGAALQNRIREFPGRAGIKPAPPAGEPETLSP